MFYKKTGLPEESELVVCTITSIQYHSVFVRLDAYNRTGMIHISEISPGRIRNLADYVEVGKKIVCKVIRIDRVKEHIDLSLRRVNEGQKRDVLNQVKKEQKAEKIVDILGKQTKQNGQQLYDKISASIAQIYDYVHQCFEDIIAGNYNIKKLNLDPATEKVLSELITERMQPPTFEIKGTLKFKTYKSNGVEIVKQTFKKIESDKVKVSYLGAGAYNVSIASKNMDEANTIKSSISKIVEAFNQNDGEASFQTV